MPVLVALDSLSSVDLDICQAIIELRLVRFTYQGHVRVGEPHDYGIIKTTRKLSFFQTEGTSGSGGPLPDWRWAELPKIVDLQITERSFAGPREVPTGRHHRFDRLIASVSRPEQSLIRADNLPLLRPPAAPR